MAYSHTNSKGVKYYLNTKMVQLNGGRENQIFYFSRDERPDTGCALPSNKEVVESSRGLLMVRNKKS